MGIYGRHNVHGFGAFINNMVINDAGPWHVSQFFVKIISASRHFYDFSGISLCLTQNSLDLN